jgi:sigma-E factor negative regulatory protein RseB
MPRRSISRLALLGAAALVAVGAAAQDAQSWIAQMNSAVEDLNYRGTFVHLQGEVAETLLIVHRNDAGRISERIMSLDGAGREIIRRENEVWCILPDTETVLLEDRSDPSPLVSVLPSYSPELSHYSFNLHRRTERIAQRRTQVVSIIPKDDYRYGYRLWLDTETAMPLKSQLVDEAGNTVEQILFTQIEISGEIPKSAVEPTINTAGFTLYRPPAMVPQSEQTLSLAQTELPSGFQLSAAMQGPMAGSRYPVNHFVVSDGLATVSVFIEDPKSTPEVAAGFSRLGTANAYSLTVGGRPVTAVGEVPQQTVEAIAKSLRAR